jgi:hypothetical protein
MFPEMAAVTAISPQLQCWSHFIDLSHIVPSPHHTLIACANRGNFNAISCALQTLQAMSKHGYNFSSQVHRGTHSILMSEKTNVSTSRLILIELQRNITFSVLPTS